MANSMLHGEGNFETSPLFGLDAFDLFNQCDDNQQLTK